MASIPLDWVKNMDINELNRQRNLFFSIATHAVNQLGGKLVIPMIDVINIEDGKYEMFITEDKFGNRQIRIENKDEEEELQH